MAQTTPPTLRVIAAELADSHPLEQAVYRATEDDSLGTSLRIIHRKCRDYFAPVNDQLQAKGLVVSLPAAMVGLGVPLLTLLGVILFAAGKVMVGLDRGKPVVFLIIFAAVVAVVGLVAFARPLFRTKIGDQYLTKVRRQYGELESRARVHPSELAPHQLATALGLWGCGLLATSAFGSMLDRYEGRPRNWNSSSGCGGGTYGGGTGCGGGGCGGGCGGGGCGGCGGS
jgi:uncharacterized protein (TIGR04222 family)